MKICDNCDMRFTYKKKPDERQCQRCDGLTITKSYGYVDFTNQLNKGVKPKYGYRND